MPCRTQDEDFNGDNGPREEFWLRRDLDDVTALLCSLCLLLLQTNNKHLMSKPIQEWYAKHSKIDAARVSKVKERLAALAAQRVELLKELKPQVPEWTTAPPPRD